MARSLTASMITQVTAKTLAPFLAAQFQFANGDVNVWSGIGDLTFDGTTFQGVGDFGGVSEVEETEEMRAVNVTFSLSGVPSSLVSTALSDDYQNRAATLWFGVLDSACSVVSDPYQVFRGRMDVMSIDDDGEQATIEVSCESRLADLQRTAGWTYTTEDQVALGYSDDRGFEFVPRLQDKDIVWRAQPDRSTESAPSSKQSKPASTGRQGRKIFSTRQAAQDAAGPDDIVTGNLEGGFIGRGQTPGR